MTFRLDIRSHMQAAWLALGLLVIAGLATYTNGLQGPFMLDDHSFFEPSMANLKFLPQQFLPDQDRTLGRSGGPDSFYRPLSVIIPMICYAAFKNFYPGYHLVNLVLLIAAAFCVYAFLSAVFRNFWLALLTALFYIVHPVSGVMVNYITASVFSAQVGFSMLSLLCYWRAEEGRDKREERREREEKEGERIKEKSQGCDFKFSPVSFLSHVLLPSSFFLHASSIFFFILALMCHETAMALPIYMVVLLIVVRRENWQKALRRTSGMWIFLAVVMVWRMRYASLNDSVISHFSMLGMSVGQYLASIAQLIVWYVAQLVCPNGLVLMKVLPVAHENVALWSAALLAVMALAGGIMFYYRREKPVVLGLGLFAAGFIPFALACVFQPSLGIMLEPHWFVVPVMGFFLIVASLVCTYSSAHPKRAVIIAALLAALWMGGSRLYNDVWAEEKRYCHYWLQEMPGFPPALSYLAKAYDNEGRYDQAKFYYHQTLTRHYKPWLALTNLGLISLKERKMHEAEKYFLAAIKLKPDSAVVLNDLGLIAYQKGELPLARTCFERAARADRRLVQARLNLAQTLLKMGEGQAAVSVYREVLAIVPHHEISLIALLRYYAVKKDIDNVFATARELLDTSRNGRTLTNVGIVFVSHHANDLAIKAFDKSIRVAPGYTPAYLYAGRLAATENDLDRASFYWRSGLSVDPADRKFQELLAKAGYRI